jgi:formate hydrogenlyase subunit 4/hydrogenase-4 membrane subunit HyfE
MVLIPDFAIQGAQMLLVLLLAPLFTGFVRKVKARLLRRQGPPLIQPYLDLVRLSRKDVVLADSASWLFRVIPYLVFAATWVAASLVPTFRTGLLFSWSADLIALIALLASARFYLALAGLDVGTSFGGIGSSREVMIASLAEPAMIMIVFTLALIAGSTQLSTVAEFMASPEVGVRVSLGLAVVGLVMVAIAENGRVPVDNPATHLELTMVHEAMVLEYSGRHLALIELSASLKLILYVSLLACLFVPWGIAAAGAALPALAVGVAAYIGKLAVGGFLLALFETSIAKMSIPRPGVPRRGADARTAGDALAIRVGELLMSRIDFDIAHLLAGLLVLISFLELYQDRLYALLNVFATHALVLAASVAWQAFIQDAPHLYVTAAIALLFKAIVIPVALHRIIVRLGIHREIEKVVGVGPAMLAGMGLVALSMVVMLRVTHAADPLAREDLAFALSVVLLGLLMMVTRRNAVGQVVGFMSLENGLVLAATGAKGMPLVVEISVAFSILIAFIVIGIFLFRIRERFDTVDVQALDRFRGERR